MRRTTGYIMDAVANMRAVGVRMVVANIPDFGDTPEPQTATDTHDPVLRRVVTDAVEAANCQLRTMTDTTGVPLLDLKGPLATK